MSRSVFSVSRSAVVGDNLVSSGLVSGFVSSGSGQIYSSWLPFVKIRCYPIGMKALGHLKIETEREEDGRWIAELPDLPGAMAYGDTRENAVANVQALAFRIAADKIEAHDRTPEIAPFTAVFA